MSPTRHGKGRVRKRGTPKTGGTQDLACPTCCQKLPPAVRVVVEDFIRRGLPEEKAVEVAAAAFGVLSIPGT